MQVAGLVGDDRQEPGPEGRLTAIAGEFAVRLHERVLHGLLGERKAPPLEFEGEFMAALQALPDDAKLLVVFISNTGDKLKVDDPPR